MPDPGWTRAKWSVRQANWPSSLSCSASNTAGNVANLLSTELRRAMTVKCDGALLSQPAPTPPAITPPAGLFAQDHTEGGELEDSLDALSDAIAVIESSNGSADLIITSPTAWSKISQFKVSDDSNQSLLGPPAVAAVRQLLSVPVTVTATVPDDLVLVADRKAILSAYGVLTLAVSEHAAFRKDNIVTRLTWRIGAVADPKRVVELRVPSATPNR